MARIDVLERSSARSTAAVITRTLATITLALDRLLAPISASAMARADAVRFSICELVADSERSSTALNGTSSSPASVSKRAISRAASSASASTSSAKRNPRRTIVRGIAARYGPSCRRRSAREANAWSLARHSNSS